MVNDPARESRDCDGEVVVRLSSKRLTQRTEYGNSESRSRVWYVKAHIRKRQHGDTSDDRLIFEPLPVDAASRRKLSKHRTRGIGEEERCQRDGRLLTVEPRGDE